MKAQVHFHGLDASAAVHDAIDAKVAKLYDHHPDLTSVTVTVEAPHRHQQRPEFHVRIEAHLPGHLIVSDHDGSKPAHDDVYLALRDAMNATRRQLRDLADRRREHNGGRIVEVIEPT